MARGRKKNKPRVEPFTRPTPEREAHNDTISAGAAMRVVPVIDRLLKEGRITRQQYDNLAYYREQAHKAEDDAKQSSTLDPERIMGGECGSRLPVCLMATPAMMETARIEREVGNRRPILQAVARDDWTLTRWCIEKHGGRERYDGKGKFVAMVPVAERRVMADALIELRHVAMRFRT